MSHPDEIESTIFHEDGSCFQNFDDKVMERIFSHFNPCEIMEGLYFVSQRWRSIIENMKKSISFNGTEDCHILQFISKFPNTIESISLNEITGSVAVILKKLRRTQKHLKRLYINSCPIVPTNNPYEAGRRLRNFLEMCRSLEVLSIKGTEYHVDDLLDAFPLLNNLRSLTIGNNPHLKVLDVITILMNCTNLQSISLYRIDGITDQDMKFLLCNKRLGENLRELSLDQVSKLTSIAYQYILNCKNLERLHINYSTGFSADTLMEIPKNLSFLRSFKIERACRISSENFCNFFQDNALKLIEFGLTDCCCHFQDDSLSVLIDEQCNNLVHLSLRNCLYLRNVSAIFNKCKYLRTLDLSGCEILECEINSQSCLNLSKIILPSHLSAKRNSIGASESVILEFQKLAVFQEPIEI